MKRVFGLIGIIVWTQFIVSAPAIAESPDFYGASERSRLKPPLQPDEIGGSHLPDRINPRLKSGRRKNGIPDTLWTKTYGGTYGDWGKSVQECASGGFIIAGWTASFGAGEYDVYLIRTNANGDTLWTKTYGGADWDYGYSVQECASGGFIIAGRTWSFGAGSFDVYLIRTNADGDTLWTKTYGGTGSDWGSSVEECASGGFIIAGRTKSFGAGFEDVYLIRTNADGDTLWTKTYGGTYGDWGKSVQECASGGFIIAGWTESFGAGKEDVYLIRTDADGDILWTKTYGGIGDDGGSSVEECASGGFIIAGYTASFGTGKEDVYLIRTDADGDILWTKTYGGIGDDGGSSVEECAGGGFIIAGRTSSFGAGSYDIYLIRTDAIWLISPNGGENWVGGSNHNIIWHHGDSTEVNHYRLLYSTDGGSDYPDTITHNISNSDTSYLWTLPLINCTTCRVKVQVLDASNNVISEDESDSNFTISVLIPFSLLAPANYSVDVDVYPFFDWEDADIGSGYYILRYGTDPNFTSGTYVDEDSIEQSEYSPSLDLLKNTIYYWKVKAVDGIGNTLWSNEYFGFQTIDTLAELIDTIPYDRTLRPENNPYIVIGDFSVKWDNWLAIQPGVEIKFDGSYVLKIGGKLISQGTSTDNISFDRTASFAGRWKGIEFTGTADDAVFQNETTFVIGSILEYTSISWADTALNAGSKDICLRHSLIQNSTGDGVRCGDNSVLIGNTIYNNDGRGIMGGRYFENNNVSYNSGCGLVGAWDDTAKFKGNTVKNNGGGISSSYGIYFENNEVSGNAGCGISTISTTAELIRNVVCDNDGTGIYGGQYLEDNIVRNNHSGIWIHAVNASNIIIKGDTITNNRAHGIYLGICNNVVIESCFVDSNCSEQVGPGIKSGICVSSNSDSVTIRSNRIVRNTGPGIYYAGSHGNICGNIIQHNVSPFSGTGICVVGSVDSITNNVITNNSVLSWGRGGGIHIRACCVLKNNIISGNQATNGGGISVYDGDIVIKYNTITNNAATDTGGAIYGNGEITQNIITHNSAGRAGGIYGDPTVLTQNNLYGNESFELEKTDSVDLTGTYNWWGTRSDQVMIEQEIWHAEDTNDTLGRVTYQPFLTSPSTQTPGQLTDIISVSLKTDSTYTHNLPNGIPMGGVLYIQLEGVDGNKYSRDLTAVWVKNLRTSHQIEPLIEETTDSSGIFRGIANVDSNTNFVTNTIGALEGDTIKVMSKVDSSKFTLCCVCPLDTVSPTKPDSLFANGSNSSPWTNDSIFTIRYVESGGSTKGIELPSIRRSESRIKYQVLGKSDTSGIALALYKLGDSPDSNYDTTGTADTNPFTVVCTIEGGETLWVWLKDGAGNLNYNNRGCVILNYDITSPLIDSTTILEDTVNFWGPFEVQTKITDNSSFNNPILFYRTSVDTEWVIDTMTSLGGGWFIDSIPELPHDSLVVGYYLTVEGFATNKSRDPVSGSYSFVVRHEVGVEDKKVPDKFVLFPPTPNPSLRNIVIKYGLPEKATVSLRLYDISGRVVKTLYSGTQEKGYYKADIKNEELAKGIYFIQFNASDFKETKKLILMR